MSGMLNKKGEKMSRDKNSCRVHLNEKETRFMQGLLNMLVDKNHDFLDIENFEVIYNRLNNACRNQDEYPAKMKALEDKHTEYVKKWEETNKHKRT